VTCPSAAITTKPLRRTQMTVVERMRRSADTDFLVVLNAQSS